MQIYRLPIANMVTVPAFQFLLSKGMMGVCEPAHGDDPLNAVNFRRQSGYFLSDASLFRKEKILRFRPFVLLVTETCR